MAKVRLNLMDPPIEDLLDKVDSKFTLVALGALRARQVNAYYNSLGEGLGRVVPPQVPSVSGKPLSIAFEEIAAAKATFVRIDPDELEAGEEGADGSETAGEADVEALALELLSAEDALEELEVVLGEAVLEQAVLEDAALESVVEDEISEVSEEPAQDEVSPVLAEDVSTEEEGPAAG